MSQQEKVLQFSFQIYHNRVPSSTSGDILAQRQSPTPRFVPFFELYNGWRSFTRDSLGLDKYRVLASFQFHKGQAKASDEEHLPLCTETV